MGRGNNSIRIPLTIAFQLSPDLRIGVGDADAGPIVDDLFIRLQTHRPTDDLIRYVVGPTVAAHAGMGTFGIVYHAFERP